MEQYTQVGTYRVHRELLDFVSAHVLPGAETGHQFWQGVERILDEFIPRNEALLHERESFERLLQKWYSEQKQDFDLVGYERFLQSIGYIEPVVPDFSIDVSDVDTEITQQAGPQLVVPLDNARYALNAANARWGSLYDALYGTDVIDEADGKTKSAGYNPVRGKAVIAYAKQYLDDTFPLLTGSHRDAEGYAVRADEPYAIINGQDVPFSNDCFVGYVGNPDSPTSLVLVHNGLHAELKFDRNHPIGRTDGAGLTDIELESALSAIVDCEDSVAAVNARDKVHLYKNWLGLMDGTLEATFTKGGKPLKRQLNEDRRYTGRNGRDVVLPGCSLLFIRNVGHLMTTDLMLDNQGREVPEGILDGIFTSLIASRHLDSKRNSRERSIYIVKPKMHGSKEVTFTNDLFDAIEDVLDLPRHTLKVGVMDEERRTSLNLKNCIERVKERIVFINTGFLDRTGDEIHTSLTFGPMRKKGEMKTSAWLDAYERLNVLTGLAADFYQQAQIGKGMWAMPDKMCDMMREKVAHAESGATTAWVPSPTAATLHALHYHQVDAFRVQRELVQRSFDIDSERKRLLEIPLATRVYTDDEVREELENNLQGLLGYVVRWVEQGVGCSKVPDIHHIGLMEDRATLRISSQHVANWLYHGVCTREQVEATMYRMAEVVDKQNAADPNYRPMTPDVTDSIAYQAAKDLVFQGTDSPSGYTEPILHRRRRQFLTQSTLELNLKGGASS
ncbi:malate synthase G [Exiguobacterium sp. SH1S21]|uniref:malate synthase G n=1 Tax=Exiguobacterium sp. SH1S21 TaxID=2510953 RepID=UPI00103FF010|nr:malate synthase G [Exiguobacterium sp. SH1S21]TCI52910.1 malate synthase G [Exiguobacterium sp. SH1S21]